MAKNSSREKPGIEVVEPSPAVKKAKDEIDQIFAWKKKKKPDKDEKCERHTEKELKPKKRKNEDRSLRDNMVAELPPPRRRTNDGLAIYSAKELGVNKPDAGGTPLCPFDCSCCF
ncbi:hypothetical protein SAY86_027288 [Trapa natans]|uniref:DUF1764-domain-containing protein n=1 Tax=Trapa natans TaxID=22666 RepID=A0AAN7KH91_TRANT|nr:hypothetical protein SAY86_027288 [Trapa natans]